MAVSTPVVPVLLAKDGMVYWTNGNNDTGTTFRSWDVMAALTAAMGTSESMVAPGTLVASLASWGEIWVAEVTNDNRNFAAFWDKGRLDDFDGFEGEWDCWSLSWWWFKINDIRWYKLGVDDGKRLQSFLAQATWCLSAGGQLVWHNRVFNILVFVSFSHAARRYPPLRKQQTCLNKRNRLWKTFSFWGPVHFLISAFLLSKLWNFRGFLWIRRSEKPSGTLHLELILSLATLEEGPNANYATGNVRTCALSAVQSDEKCWFFGCEIHCFFL